MRVNNSKETVRIFDAHAHLQDLRFGSAAMDVIQRASAAGVSNISCCGTGENDWYIVAEIAKKHECITPSFGIHPWYVHERSEKWQKTLAGYLAEFPCSGVGEVGLDGRKNREHLAEQLECLDAQMEIAVSLNRPISLHCLGCWEPLVELLRKFSRRNLKFMVHSYSGSAELVKIICGLGGYLSFSASITHRNRKKAISALTAVPLDRLLIESDAPDLPPASTAPDTVNEPSFILETVKAASFYLDISFEELCKITFDNGQRFFKGES
ncbi:MAG: TatD family hydrolase [Fibrobacteres bacterium]|nr:TatD family hydrolase [Fibrobacterota bacterium]